MKIVNCCWLIDNSSGSWPLDDNKLDDLPVSTRRRLTPLGRKTLQILNKCIGNGELMPWVISCRHGDIPRRLNLLASLAQNEMLSPTDFSMSVHNAIIGMHSIISSNKLTHTALAAGINSFESGLLETIALHKEKNESIGYVYYDYIDEAADQLTSPIECIALIISGNNEINGLSIEYNKLNSPASLTKFNILDFLEFLKSDRKKYSISVAGGEILIQQGP